MTALWLGLGILYIADCEDLPNLSYGYWHPLLLKNGELAVAIEEHL